MKKVTKKAIKPVPSKSSSNLVEAKIKENTDWRGETLFYIRSVIKSTVPDVVEEIKWRGVPVWSYHGIICTGEIYKSVVKLTFFSGATLKDPKKLFNSSLEGNARRAIDIREGEKINETAFKALLKEAVKYNISKD